MKNKLKQSLKVIFVLFLLLESANATTINFQTINLTDIIPGKDLWQYTYEISDHNFAMDTGFTIYFDYTLYTDIDPFPATPNTDWDVLTWNPDPSIPDDGVYDAYALTDNASLSNPFIVSFVWLGEGSPGAQSFDVYDGFNFDNLESGTSVALQADPITEPATLFMLCSGLLGIAGYRKKTCKNFCKSIRLNVSSLIRNLC